MHWSQIHFKRSWSQRSNTQGSTYTSSRKKSSTEKEDVTPNGTPDNHGSIIQCRIYNKFRHRALKCWSRFNNNFQAEDVPQALAALHFSDTPPKNEWFLDTGATAHITSSAVILSHATPYHGSDSVMVGNVLSIQKNLLSVPLNLHRISVGILLFRGSTSRLEKKKINQV
ncbi:hypothetical protein NE237_014801 [Protea cynaroides]|uniref:Uncharacterized protein n=1 Tax=Protea cynaroides TaxID=273540 RepID=A0A9Q0QQG4_9MAGN|nr:hypothetical protein NE237_014801 [Protea cynaroides]